MSGRMEALLAQSDESFGGLTDGRLGRSLSFRRLQRCRGACSG